ncbi:MULTISPECIES: hypothetical protein [unclassified Streptomyces]|uniref:ATP-dependent DNA ligase n=1 Tax=unclassified Streptomyces TaxID=2593676 RepID=UPI0036E0FB3A
MAVALAEAVPTLPRGKGWWYEIKFDGHRTVLWRDAETVRLQARSGRTVLSAWMDLAVAGVDSLRPGTVLDGEAAICTKNRGDFSAAQSRANSGPACARELAALLPASCAVFDGQGCGTPGRGDRILSVAVFVGRPGLLSEKPRRRDGSLKGTS